MKNNDYIFISSSSPAKTAQKTSIQTEYNGNFYRSRSEARFAVFCDELGIKHTYEPIAPVWLGGNIYYMPDFLIELPVILSRKDISDKTSPKTLLHYSEKVYVEIKGEMTYTDVQKIERFQMTATDYPLWVLPNVPEEDFFKKGNKSNQMRPEGIDEEFPYWSCGMKDFYDTGMVLCRAPHKKSYGVAHHGIGIRLEVDRDRYEINGGKSWFIPEIANACRAARQKRFENFKVD